MEVGLACDANYIQSYIFLDVHFVSDKGLSLCFLPILFP